MKLDNELDLGYALAKQVPAMHYRVTLHTDYGSLTFEGRDAERVAVLVQKMLEVKLAVLKRKR